MQQLKRNVTGKVLEIDDVTTWQKAGSHNVPSHHCAAVLELDLFSGTGQFVQQLMIPVKAGTLFAGQEVQIEISVLDPTLTSKFNEAMRKANG